MAPKPNEVPDDLHESVAAIFEQAQQSLANHKKNCVALFKLHTKLAAITQQTKTSVKFVGERAFQDVFIDMVNRVLIVKRGPAGADRIVKYVGAFVRFMNEKLVEAKSKTASSSSISAGNKDDDEEDEENTTTRFVARLLNWLLQGFVAKNKNVRYRCIYIVSEMISHLGEIDEDTYNDLRDALIERLNDKEPLIRAHSVIALSKLVGSEDNDELAPGEQTILDTLLDTVSIDPAAEVRRAALMNIPLTPATVDALLSRTRDVDPVTRKLVYTGVLHAKLKHPRQLTITQREQIVKDGLGDREPGVRVAAGKLVLAWFETVLAEAEEGAAATEEWEGDDGGVMKGLIRFLGLFDVVGPGEAAAVDAVLSIFTTKPDVPDVFVFPDAFWKHLTSEAVVLARVFVEHCVSTKDERKLESASLPVVTAFAFHVQEAYNGLLSVLEDIETAKMLNAGLDEQPENDEELEEELAKREVIMSELLRLALKLDYGDEIGRRKVFSVVKDMLAHPQLPPGLIERCLDVLKEIMPSERDLIRVVVEIVVELREGDEGEVADELEPPIGDDQSDVSQMTIRREKLGRKPKDRQDLSPEERLQADVTDIRCLMLCIAMLERVNGTFEDNSTLEGILGDLIIPSVKRKELAMREKALVSLGLCCLIAKNMALSSFQLFLSQAQNAPGELKVQVLKVIMDLLIMYDQDFFGRSEETAKQIVDFLLQILESEVSEDAQAVLATGLSKLLLAGIIKESRVLMCLALLYISPTTANNQQLRQCLSYFFPVYSYSSAANQSRVQSIFTATFDLALRMHEDLEDDQEMITPYQFGLLMVDWTNPHKAAEIAVDKAEPQPTHANLGVEILIALYDSDRTVDEQKTLLQLLGQLQIESGLDPRSIQKLHILLANHEDQSPFENSANEKLFERFKSKFSSLFEKELAEINPLEFLDDEFRDIYQRIGADVPEEGDDSGARRQRARGKRRAAESDEEEGEDEQEEEGEDEQEVEQADEQQVEVANDSDADDATQQEEDEEAASSENSPTPPPKRTRKPPARKSARQRKVAAKGKGRARQDDGSQGSDEENIPPPVTVTATPKKKGVKRIHTPGSGAAAVTSPANRKRTRVKAPTRKAVKDTTPTNTDFESPPTPTKPSRQTRGSKANDVSRQRAAKELTTPLPNSDEEEDEDDAEEVASLISASGRSTPTPPAASSDDFGGYSD